MDYKIFSWSKWSHVALVDGDYVIEATAMHGVRRVKIEEALHGTKHEFATLPCKDPQAIIDAAMTQLGKPYDFLAILGIGLKRDWQEDDKWVCSELIDGRQIKVEILYSEKIGLIELLKNIYGCFIH